MQLKFLLFVGIYLVTLTELYASKGRCRRVNCAECKKGYGDSNECCNCCGICDGGISCDSVNCGRDCDARYDFSKKCCDCCRICKDRPDCSLVDCLDVSCDGAYTPPGECCPKCPDDPTTTDGPDCRGVSCPRVFCRGSFIPPGKCCPKCPDNTCEDDDGNTIQDGESFMRDACTTCTCNGDTGEVICVAVACAPPPCRNPITIRGQCCPVCPDTCEDRDGRTREDGEEWDHDDTCETCECTRGRISCRPQSCPIPRCSNPSTPPRQCCPVCPPQETCSYRNINGVCIPKGQCRRGNRYSYPCDGISCSSSGDVCCFPHQRKRRPPIDVCDDGNGGGNSGSGETCHYRSYKGRCIPKSQCTKPNIYSIPCPGITSISCRSSGNVCCLRHKRRGRPPPSDVCDDGNVGSGESCSFGGYQGQCIPASQCRSGNRYSFLCQAVSCRTSGHVCCLAHNRRRRPPFDLCDGGTGGPPRCEIPYLDQVFPGECVDKFQCVGNREPCSGYGGRCKGNKWCCVPKGLPGRVCNPHA